MPAKKHQSKKSKPSPSKKSKARSPSKIGTISASREIAVKAVKIGKRHRKDMGDIGGLAMNIAEVGLLHPIVVTPELKLVAGERRLLAMKQLGRPLIAARVIDLDKIVRGEYAENTFRKDLTLSEAADIADAIEPIERKAAKQRQGAAGPKEGKGRKASGSGKLPTAVKGRAMDKVGRVVGKGRRTIEKARAVRDAAKAEPEKYGKLAEDMDRTGRVDGPFKRLRVMKMAEKIRAEPPPLPGNGPYRVIVADPPWPYELRKADPSHRATHPYKQMSIDDICKVDVASIAHDDCVLWLWITNHHIIRCAREVLDAWGFQEKTILTWAKDKMGTGDWLRGQTELCIMAVRGKPTVVLKNQTTLLHGPLRKNSQKPDEFFDMVAGLCPAPRYAYLFAGRFKRENWDVHGLDHGDEHTGEDDGGAKDEVERAEVAV